MTYAKRAMIATPAANVNAVQKKRMKTLMAALSWLHSWRSVKSNWSGFFVITFLNARMLRILHERVK